MGFNKYCQSQVWLTLLVHSVVHISDAKQLSFKVLSILPSSPTSSSNEYHLYGNTPLTVVFSLPVIRLGEQLHSNASPFSLVECIGGNGITLKNIGLFRWVSTSIVRFDLKDNWPPDLCFKLVINTDIKTFNGMSLVETESIGTFRYKTSRLSMSVKKVESQTALDITGGHWNSNFCTNSHDRLCAHECPMDGIVHLEFSHPVIPSRVLTLLTLDKGADLHDWVRTCSDKHADTNKDTHTHCIVVKPRSLLSDGTFHEIKLPKLSRVSYLGGDTQKDLTSHITGVLPFKFYFKQTSIPSQSYREQRPVFRRYRLYLRHGMQSLIDAAAAQKDFASVDLSPLKTSMKLINVETKKSLEFALHAKDLSTIILSAAVDPDNKYTLQVSESDSLIDGFKQPLQSSSSTFRTQVMPSYFAAPVGSVTVFDSSSTKNLLSTWPMVIRGKEVVSHSGQIAETRCIPITEENFPEFVLTQRISYDSKTTYFASFWSSEGTQSIRAPMTDQLSEVGCQISKMLQGSLTKSTRSGIFHVIGKGRYGSFSHNTVIVSDLSVVFIPGTNGRNQITVWVTDGHGADVSNALVRLFSLPVSIYGATTADVSLVGKATTGADGIARVLIKLGGDHKLTHLVSLVTHADTGGVAFDPQVAVPAPLLASQWKVRVHTDRGLYKPGDNLYVKVVARVRLGSSDNDGGRLIVPNPSAQSKFFLRVKWTSRGQPTYVPVTLSATYGTADLNLTVPMDVDFGALSLQLVRSLNTGHYESLPLGESILIADPRPPTVTMDLSLHITGDTMASPGLLVIPPGSKSAVDVRVLTKTQTGVLVEKADVVVTWKLIRGGATPKPANGAPFVPKPRCSVYGLDTSLIDRLPTPGNSRRSVGTVTGEFTVSTGSNGVSRVSFDIAGALVDKSQAPAQAGDLLEVTAQWIGPTREVVREKKSVPVADTPYAAGLSLSIEDPLPGIHFGVRLDVRVIPNAVKNNDDTRKTLKTKVYDDTYTLSLYKWTKTTAENFDTNMNAQNTPLQARLLQFLFGTNSSAQSIEHACGELVNDNGATIQCDGKLTLPEVSQYLLVVQNNRTTAGERVAAALLLGRSATSWTEHPLSALASGLSVIADRPKYAEGDVATLTFVSPFAGNTSMLVTWGNSVSGKTSKHRKQRLEGPGKHSVAIDLGAECRGGCMVNTIVIAPAQASSIELPVAVPLSKLLRMNVPRTVLMHTKLAVADPDIPTETPKVVVTFPQSSTSELVMGPGETTNLQIDVDMTAFSGGKAELMLYVTDQAFLDLKPHALPGLASSFTFVASTNGVDQKVTDTSRYFASAAGLQSTIATFKSRFAVDPWICPDSFPLRSGQSSNRIYSGFSNKCPFLSRIAIPEVDETDTSYFERRKYDLTDFPPVVNHYQGTSHAYYDSYIGHSESADSSAGVRTMSVGAVAPQSARSSANAAPTTSTKSTTPRVKMRTNVQTTPLFVGSLKLSATGRAKVKFKAPDNIARFALRVVVIGDTVTPGVFGETETHLIVRKSLSLLPSQPRIVRSRDKFSCGVTATLQDPNFDGMIHVQARIKSSDTSQSEPILYFTDDSATYSHVTQHVRGSGPHEIVFPFVARNSVTGSTIVEFTAEGEYNATKKSVITDSLQTRILVGPVSDPVMLATSVSIVAATDPIVWSEGVALPEAVPGTGSIILHAGIGHLPPVLQYASALNSKRTNLWRDGETIVSALAAPAALGAYYTTKEAREIAWGKGGTAHIAAEGLKLAVTALHKFTDVSKFGRYLDTGLFWRRSSNAANVRLNAKGAFLAGQILNRLKTDDVLSQVIGGQPVIDQLTQLRESWINAISNGLRDGMRYCRSQRYCWTDCDALAAARLVLPLSQQSVLGRDLSETVLYSPDYFKRCTVAGQADAALVQLLRHPSKAGSSAKAKEILDRLVKQLRVQGQSAYITASSQTSYPSTWEAHAKVLLALSQPTSGLSNHPLLPKLAAWVSSGGSRPGFIPSALAFASLALASYDTVKKNTKVDAWLVARAGALVLLEGKWVNPSDPVVRTETSWDVLSIMSKPVGTSLGPLIFRVQGRGEVSVSAQLQYLPARVPRGGIYQGIGVEKVIEMTDPNSGDTIPGAVSIVGLGDMVLVTIQVSTSDMLGPVKVSDLLPGGLEPVDPNVDDSSGFKPISSCGRDSNSFRGGWFWWCWDPFADRETRPDRVDWFADRLWPGTHTIHYRARAVTSGVFQLPGTAARATDTPDIMGISSGGQFVVSTTPVSHLTATEKSNLLSQKYNVEPIILKECDNECEIKNSVCNRELGKCECTGDNMMSEQGECAVIPIIAPSDRQSSVLTNVFLFESHGSTAEIWKEQKHGIRKSFSLTLPKNFNADLEEDCPVLSLAEHDVTVEQISQQDTGSVVVHVSISLWGSTGNVLASRCLDAMSKSFNKVVSNGNLSQSLKETVRLQGTLDVKIANGAECGGDSDIVCPVGLHCRPKSGEGTVNENGGVCETISSSTTTTILPVRTSTAVTVLGGAEKETSLSCQFYYVFYSFVLVIMW